MAPGSDATWLSIWQGTYEGRPFSLTIFQSGGTGARATKDGLNATGFPSGVAGTPVEVVENLTPLVQACRELRVDSAGPGRRRGGLGQICDMRVRGVREWQLSALVDRIEWVPGGIDGGQAGARGGLELVTGEPVAGKRIVELPLEGAVRFALPGGAGYGSPHEREPELVLEDVVNGYVSIEAAEREYGVVVRYIGPPDAPVCLPEHYAIDEAATSERRNDRRSR
jgi:N-methylhydantoinase B